MIEGATLLAEAVAAGAPLEAVYVVEGTESGLPPLPPGVRVHVVGERVLAGAVSTTTPQPVAAVCRTVDVPLGRALEAARFVVVLAGVADPGNAGTLVRSAAAAGADAVVLTAASVDVYNPKVVRAAAGSLFRVRLATDVAPDDLAGALRAAGLVSVGAVPAGAPPYDEDDALGGPVALVLGNEAHGLPAGLALDRTVTIPMAHGVESLNVAMAGTVLCFEIARRRRRSAG